MRRTEGLQEVSFGQMFLRSRFGTEERRDEVLRILDTQQMIVEAEGDPSGLRSEDHGADRQTRELSEGQHVLCCLKSRSRSMVMDSLKTVM